MKTNTILIIIFSVVVIGLGFLFISGNSSQTAQTPEVVSSSTLTADRKLHDFGEIDIFSGVVTTTFALTNEGAEDIIINEGTTSCGCTTAELGGMDFGMHKGMKKEFVVLAGETRDLTVIYDPLAHGPDGIGLAQRSVFLKTNSLETPELEVRIKAMVTKDNQ